MTIYQGDTSIVFRLDTGIADVLLETATEISILVQRPSGTIVTWTATQYGDTSEITYTTLAGDLDEVGDYIIQSYLEWGTSTHHGDSIPFTVYAPLSGRTNVSYLIRLMQTYYKNITVQTFTQYNASPEEGTDCEMLYEDVELFSELAYDELNNITDARNISLTNIQKYVALCHLVADYFEQTSPDWSFRSQSMGSGVSFSRGDKTGPRMALDKLLDQVQAATNATRRSGIRMGADSITRTKDSTRYPRRFKRTSIPAWDFHEDGFDEAEVPDIGNERDRTY
jgi:hypothetical protein